MRIDAPLRHQLSPSNCPLLTGLPSQIKNAAIVKQIMNLIDASKLCLGNRDAKFIEHFQQQKLTLHGPLGIAKCIACMCLKNM